jgi:hypothetical protein
MRLGTFPLKKQKFGSLQCVTFLSLKPVDFEHIRPKARASDLHGKCR